MTRRIWRSRRAFCAAFGVAIAGVAGCVNGPAVITQHVEARQLAARLHVEFTQANEAANRAVMADTDEASAVAAAEAEQARSSAEQTLQQLRPILASLAYQDEIGSLAKFASKFDEHNKLDAEILPLAVENTNLKAQRLSFGAGQAAAEAVTASLSAATGGSGRSVEAELESARCRLAILAIQVVQARHIAEADDAAMTRMEAEMSASEAVARAALSRLRTLSPGTPQFASASDALDRFMDVNRQIVELSRRNSNVRSLALTLGRKRVVAAECEELLRALEGALAAHTFAATR